MSDTTITPYFPFRRIKIVSQQVATDAMTAPIEVAPRCGFKPVCHKCGQKIDTAHSWAKRQIRDLNLGSTQVQLNCRYRKLYCLVCRQIRIEDLDLFDLYI